MTHDVGRDKKWPRTSKLLEALEAALEWSVVNRYELPSKGQANKAPKPRFLVSAIIRL